MSGESLSEFQTRINGLSKLELLSLPDEDLIRIERMNNAYPKAMAAMEAAQALPPCTSCDGEYGYADETCCGKTYCFHCLLRHQDSEACTA